MPKIKNRDHLTNVFGDLIDLAKFESKKTVMPNGCIEYAGISHRQGYQFVGRIDTVKDRYQFITAHRLQMKLKLGRDLARNEQVIHTCSNVRCVNPDHLILGNTSDRMQNMIRNGRSGHRGRSLDPTPKKQNRKYRYTDEELLWIRQANTKDISERFNISRARASSFKDSVTNGYRWLDSLEKSQ